MSNSNVVLPPPSAIRPWERPLHIFVLCAFAFSQPLFTALDQQFVYLHDIQAGWTEIAVVVLILSLILPSFFVLLDAIVIRVASSWRGNGSDSVLFVLSFLVSLSLVRPFLNFQYLMLNASVWIVTLGTAIPLSVLFTYFYRRSPWLRYWITLTTLGLVCFPGMFAYQYWLLQQNDAANQLKEKENQVRVQNPVPVIVVVFDEFSGTTLMNRNLELDQEHFPQFARLGQISTWYRNASAVDCRTDLAVPAILTGRFPSEKRPALESEYPGNLLQIVHRTAAYRMVVFEPITRLCPAGLRSRDKHPQTFAWKLESLVTTMSGIYPRLIFPDDMPVDFPPISRAWFGLSEHGIDVHALRTGLIQHLPFERRDDQLQQFVNCLHSPERPLFAFLHVELPHIPWYFLPSGHYHDYENGSEFQPPGSLGDLGEQWDADAATIARNEYRYLQQVGFVDRFIGQLLDQLQDSQLLEKSMLIVTADHGVSFRPEHSRRVPDKENLPDILSVPLFIKWPGQMNGQASDLNAESVDILPTIAEVLGLELPEPVDGISLSSDGRRPRKSLYVEQKLTVIEPVIPRLDSAVQRRMDVFADGSWDHPPRLTASHPDWHGRSVANFSVEDRPLPGAVIAQPEKPVPASKSEFVPCLIRGSVDQRTLQSPTADLVVAVNGIIRDSGLTYKRKYGKQGFEFLISEAEANEPPGTIDLFLVEQPSGASPQLRRIAQLKSLLK